MLIYNDREIYLNADMGSQVMVARIFYSYCCNLSLFLFCL